MSSGLKQLVEPDSNSWSLYEGMKPAKGRVTLQHQSCVLYCLSGGGLWWTKMAAWSWDLYTTAEGCTREPHN